MALMFNRLTYAALAVALAAAPQVRAQDADQPVATGAPAAQPAAPPPRPLDDDRYIPPPASGEAAPPVNRPPP